MLPPFLPSLFTPTPPNLQLIPEIDQPTTESLVRAANELSYCLLDPLATGQEESIIFAAALAFRRQAIARLH